MVDGDRLLALPPHPFTCRLWECMTLPDMDLYGEIMQQADASALRLFEALVVTLPQTLLQTYVLICTDIGVKSPGSLTGIQIVPNSTKYYYLYRYIYTYVANICHNKSY